LHSEFRTKLHIYENIIISKRNTLETSQISPIHSLPYESYEFWKRKLNWGFKYRQRSITIPYPYWLSWCCWPRAHSSFHMVCIWTQWYTRIHECMCILINMHACIHTRARKYIYVYILLYIYIYIYHGVVDLTPIHPSTWYKCMFIYSDKNLCILIYMYIDIDAHIYVYIYAYIFIHVSIFILKYIYVYRFTIKMVDGRLIKLQTTAMKHLKVDNRFHSQMEKNSPSGVHKPTKHLNVGNHHGMYLWIISIYVHIYTYMYICIYVFW
jgi:hypothetical protein